MLGGATILEALRAIDAGGEAITFVVDTGDRVIGTLTDGDIRRAILRGASLEDRVLLQVMRRDFTAVTPQDGRAEVLDLMRARQIERIPVLGPMDTSSVFTRCGRWSPGPNGQTAR